MYQGSHFMCELNWITVGGSPAVDIVLAFRWSLKWIYFAGRWSIIGNGLTGRRAIIFPSNRFIFPMIDQRKKVPVIRAIISPPNCFRWSIKGNKCRSEERSSPRLTVSDDRSSEREINSFERSSERQNDVNGWAFPDWKSTTCFIYCHTLSLITIQSCFPMLK